MVGRTVDCYTESLREGKRKHRHHTTKVLTFIDSNMESTKGNNVRGTWKCLDWLCHLGLVPSKHSHWGLGPSPHLPKVQIRGENIRNSLLTHHWKQAAPLSHLPSTWKPLPLMRYWLPDNTLNDFWLCGTLSWEWTSSQKAAHQGPWPVCLAPPSFVSPGWLYGISPCTYLESAHLYISFCFPGLSLYILASALSEECFQMQHVFIIFCIKLRSKYLKGKKI